MIVQIICYLTSNREFEKNSKKIQKIIKHHKGSFSRKSMLGMAEKEKKKINIPINSYPTRNRKFQKLKNTITASFQAKQAGKG